MDSNDIVFNAYSIDFLGIIQAIFGDGSGLHPDSLWHRLGVWWDVYSVIALILSALFFLGFIYAKIRGDQVAAELSEQIAAGEALWKSMYAGEQNQEQNRWANVKELITSFNPNDWKAAIIEADIILEEALTNGGFPGDTIGERLKAVPRTTFASLDDAWEAHKVRNSIAHDNADFVLTQKLAQATIMRFERALTELGYFG